MSTLSTDTGVSSSTCPYQTGSNIELYHIVECVKKKWKVCLGIICGCTVIFGVLAVVLPKEYLVESILLPPTESSVNTLLVPAFKRQFIVKDLFVIENKDLYYQFLDNLRSVELRQHFFNGKNIILKYRANYSGDVGDEVIFENEFNRKFDISYDEGSDGDTKIITIELSGDDPFLVTEWLNDYIRYIDIKTIDFVKDAIRAKLISERKAVQDKILSARAAGEKKRANELDRIVENLSIAKQLGIVEPADVSFNSYSLNVSSETGLVESQKSTPDYLKGTRVLTAEWEMLKKRKNMDLFVPGLLKLVEEREYLDKFLQRNYDAVHAARIDRLARLPMKPDKPNKVLFVAVGISLGMLLAIMFILSNIVLNERLLRRNSSASKSA